MAESDRGNEQRILTEEFIDKVDKLTKSPSERAKFIWLVLADGANKKVTNWDLICFCVETLGFMSSEFPWLREAAISISKIVYKAHYLNTDRIIASENEVNLEMNIPKMTGR
ncbi:hypothetical protein LCGC14_1132140 [marine sediment metagenome]|uniref:Uncharacterized protein n=1 Tax=marine sediment metagenome TaxID=412755 RepID=A0A0F9IX96_9ZZZZ